MLLGTHRIMCGDSTKVDAVEKLLQGETSNLMVTDPPYGINYTPDWRNKAFGEGNRSIGEVVNDHEADWYDAYVLFPGKIAYVWHAGNKADVVADSLHRAGFEILRYRIKFLAVMMIGGVKASFDSEENHCIL